MANIVALRFRMPSWTRGGKKGSGQHCREDLDHGSKPVTFVAAHLRSATQRREMPVFQRLLGIDQGLALVTHSPTWTDRFLTHRRQLELPQGHRAGRHIETKWRVL